MAWLARHLAVRGRALVVMCACVGALGAPLAHGDEIRLERSAHVAAAARITLGDVAVLDGAYAQSLRDLVIVVEARPARGHWVMVDLAMVRSALEAQGVRMSALDLSGRVCMVRVGEATPTRTELPVKAEAQWHEHLVRDVQGTADVEGVIVRQLAQSLGLEPKDRIRVRFGPELDEAIELGAGLRMSIELKSEATGGAVLVGLTAYSGEGGVERAWTIKVEAQVWRTVLRMTRTVNRRQAIGAGDVVASQQWVDVGDAIAHDLREVLGAEARVRLSEGAVVRTAQLQAPVAVRRGDLVQVHCLSGGLVVRGRARALEQGRIGDVIECRLEDARGSFLARVDGAGRVVVEAGGHTQAQQTMGMVP